jgi:hypothetical protein
MTRKELVPFKRAALDATDAADGIPGCIVLNVDALKTTNKPRYYVFDPANFNEFVPADATELNLVVQVISVKGSKDELVSDLPQKEIGGAAWTKATILKLHGK